MRIGRGGAHAQRSAEGAGMELRCSRMESVQDRLHLSLEFRVLGCQRLDFSVQALDGGEGDAVEFEGADAGFVAARVEGGNEILGDGTEVFSGFRRFPNIMPTEHGNGGEAFENFDGVDLFEVALLIAIGNGRPRASAGGEGDAGGGAAVAEEFGAAQRPVR